MIALIFPNEKMSRVSKIETARLRARQWISLTWIQRAAWTGLIMLATFGAVPVFGNTITVTNTADSGAGSLRNAIATAAPGDTINFSVTFPATITLASTLTLTSNLTISGPGVTNLAISGGRSIQVFFINAGVTATISGLTIENGLTPGGSSGGGIYNAGTLTLTNCTVSGNIGGNESLGGNGGGISNTGILTVTNTTVSGNSTPYHAGGIFNSTGATLNVTNSTVSGNLGTYSGGMSNFGMLAISNSTVSGNTSSSNSGGIYNAGTITMTNSTVSGNSTPQGGGILNDGPGTLTVTNSTFSGNSASSNGGGIWNQGTLTLKGTILANSRSGGNCSLNGGTNTSDGHNLSDDTSCSGLLTQIGDLNDTAAGLDPAGLKSNGGPTQTIALLPTSPALDAIPLNPTNYCTLTDGFTPVATDQRGVTRPQGPACDIGAFESSSDDDSAFSILNGGNTFNGNQTVIGAVTARTFVGDGSGLTGVTAVNSLALGSVPASNYARLDIGNIFSGSQTVNGNMNANAFVGDGSALTNVTTATANFANTAGIALSAGNAASLGNIAAGNYARLDVDNAFTGNQNVAGGSISVSGTSGVFIGNVTISGLGGINAGGNTGQVAGTFVNNANLSTNDALYALHTGLGNAIHGVNTQTGGSTVALFESTYPGGPTRGMVATNASPAGVAGVLQNSAGGKILSLQNGSGEVSSVDGSGVFHFAAGQTFPGTGAGTITGITAGAGLFGGGTSGNVGLNIPSAGVINSMLANPSLTVAAGTGLTGGGTVSLGGTTTVSLSTQTCAAGSAVSAHPFTCSPFATLGTNNFSGNQSMPNLSVAGGIISSQLIATSLSGIGVSGSSTNSIGVFGSSSGGYAIFANSLNGIGVYGTTSGTGAAVAAGFFAIPSSNAGNILLGQSNNVTRFSVNAKGDVAASGSVAIGGGTPILEHLSATLAITVPPISPKGCAPFITATITGASDGDTLALGVKNALTASGALEYFAWVSAPNTVSIRVCNPRGPTNGTLSDTIRVDIWKH